MVDLATVADVQTAMERPLTPEEEASAVGKLAKASRLFRKASGQDFTPGTSTVRLKCNPASRTIFNLSTGWPWGMLDRVGVVYLKQRPLVSVDSVLNDNDVAVDEFQTHGSWLFVPGFSASDRVTVTYTHGDAVVPPEVVETVASMVARALSIPEQARGGANAIQETTGPFTTQVQFAKWASGGGVQLSPSDKEFAETYKVPVPQIWVGRPG